MISVSDSWKEAHKQFILPESFVEITCGVIDVGLQGKLTATGGNEEFFSNVQNVTGDALSSTAAKYATLERNLWVLDGSCEIIPDSEPYETPGYVGVINGDGQVTIALPEVRNVAIPGLTITWDSMFECFPTEFTVVAKNGSATVASTTVTNNASVISEVALELSGYDSITITATDWCFPDRRPRIDLVAMGHNLVFDKKDIISYSHEQYGCLNSGELPKNSIQFELNNVDGRWNPSNPTGLERYLSERQRVVVRYGLNLDGKIEWIKGGTFYLSEWRAPSSGLTASFTARDIFEYLLNEPYSGDTTGTLDHLVSEALSTVELPSDFTVSMHSSLSKYSATIPDEKLTAAEVIQMCANATRCIIRQDRDGVLQIKRMSVALQDYLIDTNVSYVHPDVSLTKPLRKVAVSYGTDGEYVLDVGTSGETQTLTNPLISSEEQAAEIAEWVQDRLEGREVISGEFRADPRLDLYDLVTVKSKYGSPYVVITSIKYSYTGSFRGEYSGRKHTGGIIS